MDEDGIALVSTAHPRAAWYQRLWTWLRRPYLSPDSLETVEIEVREPPRGGLLNAAFFGRNPVSNEDIEKEIIAKGLTAPRVTPQMIEDAIAAEYVFTADKATQGCPQMPSLALLTICVLVLKNGFTVTGESACASPENFDADLGAKIARQHAKDKVWMLEGYLLKERLHRDAINRSSDGGDFGDS